MTIRITILMLAMLLAGCAVPMRQPDADVAGSIVRLQNACLRLACREPNQVVARYFSRIVDDAGSACVVHIFPASGQPPWRYWDEYIYPLRRHLARSRVHIYSPRQALGVRAALRDFYRHQGVPEARLVEHAGAPPAAVLPPYRSPYCRGRPVLEVFEGARLVSDAASPRAEGVRPVDRADRTVLIVLEPVR